jgi:DNA repair protein RadC
MATKRMRDIDTCDKPREKLAKKGAVSLTDAELIATILGMGTSGRDVFEISREVAGILKDTKGSSHPTYEQLIGIEGIGPSKACILLSCFEIARRYGSPQEKQSYRITCPEDMLEIPEVRDLIHKKQEHFMTVTLNGASEVIQSRIITMGLLNHSLVHPREVYADAIADRAASIICVHNHPSGNPEPSIQDIEITRQLAGAGEILGINLLDHVIITKKGVTSLRETGIL